MGYIMLSWLDRFICSVELAKCFHLADLRSLIRPLSSHTPGSSLHRNNRAVMLITKVVEEMK